MMKNYKFLFALIAAFTLTIGISKSQLNELTKSTIDFEGDKRTCLQVRVEPSAKDTEKAIQKYLKKAHGVKVGGGKMMKAEEVVLGSVSGKKMDLYLKATESKDETILKCFGRFGYDIFLTPDNYPNEFQALESTLDDFLKEFLNDYYQDEIKSSEKDLAKAVKAKDKDLKAIEKLTKSNESAKDKIAEMEKEIESNEKDSKDLNAEVDEQLESIDTQKSMLDAMREKLQMVNNK